MTANVTFQAKPDYPVTMPKPGISRPGYDLSTGEAWESWVVAHLRSYGLDCRRLDQRFIPSDRLWVYKDELRLGRSPAKSAERYLVADRSLLPKYQIDLALKTVNGKLRLAEVKSKPSLGHNRIWLGKAASWDLKDPNRVTLLFLVDQPSGQIYLAPDRSHWGRIAGADGLSCYEVPRAALMPLEEWIYAITALETSWFDFAYWSVSRDNRWQHHRTLA